MTHRQNAKKIKKPETSAQSRKQLDVKKPHFEIEDEQSQSERFKQTLQWLLEDRNISEAELSRLTNVSPATIHRLIYGITDPRLTTLRAIASFFKIRIEQLIGDYPIPSITHVSSNNSEKILFSAPILIPFVDWDSLPNHIDDIGELTMGNWANWHATANEIENPNPTDYFATKLSYTAGNLLHAESTLIVRTLLDNESGKIGDCIIGNNDGGSMFIGQISGRGNEIIIKGGSSISVSKCKIYGIVIKSEMPFSKIARYTDFIETK